MKSFKELKSQINEAKTPISDKWGKTPKLKIGDVELIRGKSGVHTIKKSGKSVGDFSLEDDSDMWVVNYVNRRGQGTFSDLDAMVKDIQSIKESVEEGREDLKKAFLKGPKKTGKDVEKELKKVKAGSKLSIQHNKGIGRSGVGGGVVISVKGDKVKIKPTASNEPSEIDAKDITFMTIMKESVDESKPAGYGNTDVRVGDEFEKNKLTLKVIAVSGKKVTVKKKGKKQSLMPITQFDTWTKINESVETDLDALFEEELREDYFSVQYYNGNKNAVDDKFKNFKTKAEADKYAKRGNAVDRVGGEYKVFKVKGRMEESVEINEAVLDESIESDIKSALKGRKDKILSVDQWHQILYNTSKMMWSKPKIASALKKLKVVVKESVELDEIFSQSQMKKAIEIARKSSGNYDKAYAQIEKIKKGLADHPTVATALKSANEELNMKTFNSFRSELTEAISKGFVGEVGNNHSMAILIDGVDSRDGQRGTRDAMDKIKAFQKTAKKAYSNSKGKATIPSVKKEIKLQGATQYYAKWQSDSSSYKDDSVEIWFTK